MSGTKTNKIATLEDVTRRCSIGIATRASLLEEGVAHARHARTQLGEAERCFGSALGALNVAKPAFAGTSEYMLTATRLLTELTRDLEADLAELRLIQSSIQSWEEPMNGILQQLVVFSVETISARIRGRMNKLGGDFSSRIAARSSINLGQIAPPSRRRPDSMPPRELSLTEFDEAMPMDNLVQAGLENFERGGALLEGCHEALLEGQAAITAATKELEALKAGYRNLVYMEGGSNSLSLTNTLGELERLIREVDGQFPRLERLAAAPDRVRQPLLAILDNMGRLLLNGLLSEANPAEVREVSTKELFDRTLAGDNDALAELLLLGDDEKLRSVSDALYHAARSQDLEPALCAVSGLRFLAKKAPAVEREASDNLLSLSNLTSVPEAVRAAATAALVDLAEGSGLSV